jgi:membrane protein DedA with SNARE-associated domain
VAWESAPVSTPLGAGWGQPQGAWGDPLIDRFAGFPNLDAMSSAPELTGIVGWVVSLMDALGAPGVGLAIALENIFPPLPSEVFLPLAGFTAARGEMSLVAAIIWTTLGSLVGALALYGIGAALGRNRLRAIVDRMPLVNLSDVDKAEEWFARHGNKAVFFGRMVPLVRSMISVPAGVERMPVLLFAALTTAGSLIWNTAFVMAGYGLGESWHVVEQYAGIASKVVLVAVVLAVVGFIGRRVWLRRQNAEAVDAAIDAELLADSPTETIPVVSADSPTVQIPVTASARPGPPTPGPRPGPPPGPGPLGVGPQAGPPPQPGPLSHSGPPPGPVPPPNGFPPPGPVPPVNGRHPGR